MKLVSYTRLGKPEFGAIKDQGVISLTGKLVSEVKTLKQAIERNLLEKAKDYIKNRPMEYGGTEVSFLPVIPDPQKIFCVGLNYVKHRAETGRPDVAHPTIFTRFPDSQTGHRQPLLKPKETERFDYEGELAIVIDRGGRRIPESNALEHVAGFACYNDGSVRDWQKHTSQFTPGKTFPNSGGFGPYLVTVDEISDYTQLPIETRLNGRVMQKATLADLIFPLPRLIHYISSFTPLSPGDVIVTGTPGGVGDRREPPIYLQHGDLVEVDIGPVGTLINSVNDETLI